MMDKRNKQILELYARLDNLIRNQDSLAREIKALRSEIDSLSAKSVTLMQEEPEEPVILAGRQGPGSWWSIKFPDLIRVNTEEFIGGNLINKIGIVILILGVGIGIKFAIDRDLISPLVRLLLGYMVGIMLLFLAHRTRRNYLNFSAVLASGSLATVYFITYAGNSYYAIIPQSAAYILMITITVYAIFLSLNYDKEVIAIIGLVGAYAVPYLLGRKTENYLALFLYISIINGGVLVVSIRKFWRWLLYGAFIVTWLMYISWQRSMYVPENDFRTAILFGFIFFCLFYLSLINHKIFYKKKFQFEDILFLIANSFIFYGTGYFSLSGYLSAEKYTGLFTLGNAAIHLAVTGYLYKKQHPDKNLRQFVSGLALVFFTITIPVEFDASWVTLFWFLEAMILFYIGRSKKVSFYEYFSYLILVLGFYSLLDDWSAAYASYHAGSPESRLIPFLNVFFMTGLIAMASTASMNYIHFRSHTGEVPVKDPTLKTMLNYGMAGILIFISYYVFRNEIAIYWNQLYIDSETQVPVALNSESTYLLRNPDIRLFKILWILIYSMIFSAGLTLLNARVFKIEGLAIPLILINSAGILVFLLQGLYVMGELRENYLDPDFMWKFNPGKWNIGIRYVGLITVAGLIILNDWYTRKNTDEKRILMAAELFTSFAVLWVLTSELVHWQDMAGVGGSYKIGISILWGVFSLMMVIIGIWKRKKYLRIGAIVLFGITLIKLFFYDLTDLDTIARTIVFISLGILLLIISFLYNKYNRVLFD